MMDKFKIIQYLNKKISFFENEKEKSPSEFYTGQIQAYKDVLLSLKLGDFDK